MGSTLKSLSVCVALLWAIPAYAAPGDPRFLQGTVEWPAALTAEPIVIVRGDDGHVYSADVGGARRQGSDSVCVGARVALLVLEGARPHEVTAIVIGTGDAVSLSRALSGALRPAPAVAVAPTPVVDRAPAPAPSPTPVLAMAPSPAAVVPTPPASTPSTPAPAAATAPAPPAAAVTAAAVAPPPVPVLLPAVAATPPPPAPVPAPAVTSPAAAPTVVVVPPAAPIATPAAATTPAVAPAPPTAKPSTPPTPPAVAPSPAPGAPGKATGPSGERKQWARLDGRVQSVEGALLVLRADNGSIVMVDISQLNPNVTSALRRERLVSVYGYPIEQKFEAAGYIELDPSHPEPPRVRHR